jgi:pimeloyl-ACP methyl ester carboxylesterase
LRIFRALLIISLALLGSGFFFWNPLSIRPATLPNGAKLEPAECWFENTELIRIDCAYLYTRKQSPDTPVFKLPVLVMRDSWFKNSNTSMIGLAGGPGGASYIDKDSMPYWISEFVAQDWGLDVVMFDQRGTGLSEPLLRCKDSNELRLETLAQDLSGREDFEQFKRQMQHCYDQYAKQPEMKPYLKQLSTSYSASDIADLRDLLDVEQWVLNGVSYGTRLALETAREYPDIVKSMVLDSVYPPRYDGFETLAENSFNGIQRLMQRCETDELCNEVYPDLSSSLMAALNTLSREPLLLQVPREDSKKPSKPLMLTAERLILLLDYTGYDSRLFGDIPAGIKAVNDTDTDSKSLLKLASNYLEVELFEEFSDAVYMVIECSENGQFKADELMRRLQPFREQYPMLDWSHNALYDPQMCVNWRNSVVTESRNHREPASTDKPTLILAGALDSVTPPEWGKQLAANLPNSRYLEYADMAHAVLSSSLCASDEVQLFLNPELKKTAFCDKDEREYEQAGRVLEWVMPRIEPSIDSLEGVVPDIESAADETTADSSDDSSDPAKSPDGTPTAGTP